MNAYQFQMKKNNGWDKFQGGCSCFWPMLKSIQNWFNCCKFIRQNVQYCFFVVKNYGTRWWDAKAVLGIALIIIFKIKSYKQKQKITYSLHHAQFWGKFHRLKQLL